MSKKEKMFDMSDLRPRRSSQVSPAAMPIDITGDVKVVQDYANIPCEKICEYRKKDPHDVIDKEDPEYQALVSSIEENGVYEAIIVRPVTDEELKETGILFEVLSGHHRLEASRDAGKKSIISKINRDCTDEEAEDIYRVTNLLRRKQSVRDLAYGWWHYFNMTRYKSPEEIDELISKGDVSESFNNIRDSKKTRNLYRYARLHSLTDEMLDLVEKKLVSLKFAEQISFIEKAKQNDLLPYKASLKTTEKAKQLRDLSEGKIEGESWSSEAISKILFPQQLQSEARKRAKDDAEFINMIRETIPSPYHEREAMLDLIREAISEYFIAHSDKVQPQKQESE